MFNIYRNNILINSIKNKLFFKYTENDIICADKYLNYCMAKT